MFRPCGTCVRAPLRGHRGLGRNEKGKLMNVAQVVNGREIPDMIRLHCRFEGWVQGVGFRWTMQKLAVNAGISGWVRNEDDGAVECELQGPGTAVCKLLRQMDKEYAQSRNRLRRPALDLRFDITSCEELPPVENEPKSFRVR